MTKIGISINEVIRDFLGQLIYTYKKYIGTQFMTQDELDDLKESDFVDFNFNTKLGFKSPQDYIRFLYTEASLEIFGHGDQLIDGLMTHFNRFLEDLRDEDFDVQLVSKEANKSIPATFFFLSKTACSIDKLRFVKKDAQEWGNVDVLITANPVALANKPTGKLAIKIKSPYNEGVAADYVLESIMDIIKDVELRNKILNTKITTFEDF